MSAKAVDSSTWIIPGPPHLKESARSLFENYSGIAPEQVPKHIELIRDKAFSLFPYPCIGFYVFLELYVAESLPYAEVLRRLKDGQQLIDIGCCFGQDIRKLVFDGAPKENIRGIELQNAFTNMGYELFRDKDKLTSNFINGDFFDSEHVLEDMDGSMDIVYSAMMFHLFNWENQVKGICRAVRLLRPKPGSLMFGIEMAGDEAGIYNLSVASDSGGMYRHTAESYRKLWDEVSRKTKLKFRVEIELGYFKHRPSPGVVSKGMRNLMYAAYME